MSHKHHRVILEGDVFELTPKGQNELGGSATSLAPSVLEVLVLIDGKSTVDETAARARTIEKETVLNILGNLLYDGLIEFVKDQAASLDFVDFFQTKGPVKPSEAAIAKAKKETAATTLLLQQQGYFVRIARRAGTAKTPEETRMLSVLVVEDEPHLANLLKHVLANEGFNVRTAKDRDEIVAEFRRGPRPDLVLLDVMLPDVDGFEVLLKIRQHPGLETLPVVMLTAKATRDAVLKGLASGADGYITKPFDIDVLVKAVNFVLGLSEGGQTAGAIRDPWNT
jgi:two-component system OmpR family response regulator